MQSGRGERQPKKSIPHTGDDLDLARAVKGNRITACLCLSAFYWPLTKAFTGPIPSYFVPASFFSLPLDFTIYVRLKMFQVSVSRMMPPLALYFNGFAETFMILFFFFLMF